MQASAALDSGQAVESLDSLINDLHGRIESSKLHGQKRRLSKILDATKILRDFIAKNPKSLPLTEDALFAIYGKIDRRRLREYILYMQKQTGCTYTSAFPQSTFSK